MPKYLSHLLIEALQHQTNTIIETAVKDWQALPHNLFARKMPDGGWSANECIQHLNAYGYYYLPVIEKAILATLPGSKVEDVFTAGFLGNYFTKLMTPVNGLQPKKKMKAPKDKTPQVIVDSQQVIAIFISQQEHLIRLLQKAQNTSLNSVYIPISISRFIKLKLGDTFNFLVMHNVRHVLQAQRALGKADAYELLVTKIQKALL